jgi:hypothetical protein
MKRLWLNIALFLLPLILVVLLIPVDKRLNFVELKEDCFYHGVWLYDRIHLNPAPIDIAFLGSSHTVNSINDTVIMNACGDTSLHIVNLGYCRYGVNLYYAILKEVIRMKRPKIVFIEVREEENRYSHPVFPYIADPVDVVTESPFFNQDLISDYADFYGYRIKLLKTRYFREDTTVSVKAADYGFASSPDTASPSYLAGIMEKNRNGKRTGSPFMRGIEMAFPRHYLGKIAKLCNKAGIRLMFIYIPQYGNSGVIPKELSTYQGFGKVLIPPDRIFEDPDNWFDENHLNQSGASKLSEWIGLKIKQGI